jgi:spore photoproduct lyase
MSEKLYFPQEVFVEKASIDYPLTKRILRNIGQVPVRIIENSLELIEKAQASRDAIGEGKKYLLIKSQEGKFLKPCPCTPSYIGCNYHIINLQLNCPLDCTYCILQHYLTNPLITVHVNLEDLWDELDAFLLENRRRVLRIGTGELGDSLVLDHITENSMDLISYFREKSNVWFELKTKTTNLKNVLKAGLAKNIVISWSLNSERIAQETERSAPSVDERIQAASEALERGFKVGFHFDPLILYPECEKGYSEVIKKLFQVIDPSRVAWMSLGSLRFPPPLKAIIKERFPQTKIIYHEFIQGMDGKQRYFKPLRQEMYKSIVSDIQKWGTGKIPLYFCMEDEGIWRNVVGWVPRGEEDLESYLSLPPPHSKM